MIVSLTGTLLEVQASVVVLDVAGVGYELGVSAMTSSALPPSGTSGVTLLTRLVVREGAIDLYGFGSREERTLFDRLTSISHVGPKLALSVLSTFSPAGLVSVVASEDATRMSTVPGVGKKTASRLIMELADVLAKDPSLRTLADTDTASSGTAPASAAAPTSVEKALAYALRRLGGRS